MIAGDMRKCFTLFLLSAGVAAWAQLPAPNAAGASAGHDIFAFHDIDAAHKFWTALGGEPAQLAQLKMTKFPGVLFLMRQGNPQGGTEGSSIDYIGFKVRSLKDSLAKWDAAGIKPMPRGTYRGSTPGGTSGQVFLMGPDDVKVRVTEDRSLATPIAADMIDMMVPDVAAAQAWYKKNFGAKLVKHGNEMVAELPGSNILFTQAKGPVAGTKGRAFDRIGIEVKNVEETCKAVGVANVNRAKQMDLAVCVLTDPWGTFIEISQGLAAVK
jgi:catechol 2,3-dioxygenase-like lactoylglutathione lyase family enzyme